MVKLETLRSDALAEYLRDEVAALAGSPLDGAGSYPYSPARATKAVAKKRNVPASRLVGLVAEVYYRENGSRSPLRFARGKATPAAVRNAVRKRRDARGRLGRWEVIAYSLAAALGTPDAVPAVATVKRYYDEAGGDRDASYTGRGTRAGAPKTRESETAEVDTTLA